MTVKCSAGATVRYLFEALQLSIKKNVAHLPNSLRMKGCINPSYQVVITNVVVMVCGSLSKLLHTNT